MKRFNQMIFIFLGILFIFPAIVSYAGDSTVKNYIMRFPDVYKETVVFSCGEDLWKAPVTGGTAVRLTIHDGEERFPKFSPDGKLIAFTGEYDGNADVYVMNTEGGNITRVTFHPEEDQVVGWHPVKNKIVFVSRRESYNRFYRLFLISPDGTGLETLILNVAAAGSFSPDGTKIAYNKERRENRTWKRYVGGRAQEVYVYDFNTDKEINISNFKGTDRIPMWIGDSIYFSSDRNHTLNIFAYHTGTQKTKQVTFHDFYDIRRPSKGIDKIVYENGGQLWLLDTITGKTGLIPIRIPADAPEARPTLEDVTEFITGIDISPSGNRALVVARGEVFSLPKKDGPTRNLTADSGARDKDAVWSPDGKSIAYLSDKDGEYQIYVRNGDKPGDSPRKLTQFKDGYRHTLRWSPDSKKIAFTDQTLHCYYVEVQTGKITTVDKAEFENIDVALDLKPIYDLNWSPDSRFLTYSKLNADQVIQVYIYSLDTGKVHCVSNGIFNDFHPVFSNDGEHLFFVSNRRFKPVLCDFEWEMVYKKVAGIYCLTLKKDGLPLLPLLSDEETGKPGAGKSTKKVHGKANEKSNRVIIDFDGISERIEALPLDQGNYRYLAVNDSTVFYLNGKDGDFNRFEFRGTGLQDLGAYDFKKRENRTVIEDINNYRLSADGTHIVYIKDTEVGILESSAKESEGNTLDLAGVKMRVEPRKEWMQIYNEAWRMERDFYYDSKMKGIDWVAMGEKYRALVPMASCRQDIVFLLGELIGELNTSHTYVRGGDKNRTAEKTDVGLLGVDWMADNTAKRYQFKKIYKVPDWSKETFPPLAGPGIHVKEGDYLLAVNGVSVTTDRNIYSYFQDMAKKQVTLLVNSNPSLNGAVEITVKPLAKEFKLRYLDWVEHNRQVALKASDGRIGYIYFPDTYITSAVEFPKYFYSQLSKQGIIVDGRYNGGGLDPDIFLQRLNKKPHSYWTRRYSHHQMSPSTALRAHFVCITDRHAGSGGDELPYLFRHKGMGPVIGTRTWGGLVGVSMTIDLVDGGAITAPDYRIYNEKGEWIIENIGVEPDITVDLHPAEMAKGHDAQLMKAIDILMEKIEKDPKPWPKPETWPVEPKHESKEKNVSTDSAIKK